MKVSDQPACTGCPLREAVPHADFVPPKMGAGLRLAIGMNPGSHEVAHRPVPEPFVGPSGALLNIGYAKVGVRRTDVTVANVCQCRIPFHKNLFPTDEDAAQFIEPLAARQALRHCWNAYVVPLLRARRWERVDLLGAPALEYGTGKRGIKPAPRKACWAGTQLPLLDAPELGDVAVATMHPAFLMREADFMPLFYTDLRRPLGAPPERYTLQATPADIIFANK